MNESPTMLLVFKIFRNFIINTPICLVNPLDSGAVTLDGNYLLTKCNKDPVERKENYMH